MHKDLNMLQVKTSNHKVSGSRPITAGFFSCVPAFSLFMGNLNSENTYEEIKEAASKFFKKESLDIQDVRLGGSKYVSASLQTPSTSSQSSWMSKHFLYFVGSSVMWISVVRKIYRKLWL